MSGFQLSLRRSPASRVDAAPLAIGRESKKSDIVGFVLRSEQGERIPLGELFSITSRKDDAVYIEGDLSRFDGLGTGMTAGHLFIEGNVGHRTGEDLAGGRITVRGNAGDDLGSHMSGGAILVHGNAGNRVGSARPGAKKGMSGGDIIILGNAGDQTGGYLRRGTIAVAGSLGDDTLHAALAGTILSLGDVGGTPGRLNKRGSLITFGTVRPPATYRYACTYNPAFVRILLKHLQRSYGFPVTARHFEQPLDRYCGDFAELARGEILCTATSSMSR